MKNLILLLIPVLLSGCADAVMAPSADRKVEFIEPTKATQIDAYKKTVAFLAKNLGDSNRAVKMKDDAAFQIVSQVSVPCNIFRQTGDPNDYSLRSSLDFQAKDKRVRMAFEDLTIVNQSGKPFEYAYNQITTQAQAERAKECLRPLKDDILKSFDAPAAKDW